MKSKVTSLEVAALAGVSQSAVSRVYSPGAPVSRKTEEKIRQAAAKLGYRPNVLARSLITGKSRIVGMIVSYLNNQFYPDAIEKFSNALQAHGYHAMMFMASNGSDSTDKVIDELLDYQVDGIVTASVGMSSNLTERCKIAGIPIVQFNRRSDDSGVSSVCSDNFAGGRKIAELFVISGHQRIGYIAGWEDASTQKDREAGFLQGLSNRGQTLFARAVGNYDFEAAQAAAREMFDRKTKPDAVFVANDHMAFAVMDVLRHELGLKVPEDVSVAGYDDVPLAGWSSYNLTTVRQPANRMVAETIRLLLGSISNHETQAKHVAIDGPLILRESVRDRPSD